MEDVDEVPLMARFWCTCKVIASGKLRQFSAALLDKFVKVVDEQDDEDTDIAHKLEQIEMKLQSLERPSAVRPAQRWSSIALCDAFLNGSVSNVRDLPQVSPEI